MTALSGHERAALLGIAQAAIRHHLGLAPAPDLPESGPLSEPRGAFVTLRVRGALRGCLGTFTPSGSLARAVSEMAVAAATRDPRFPRLEARELPDLDVHVSVLGPLTAMGHPSEIVIGRHGLVVKKGWHRGTLLPSVAVESGWDATTFLDRTCLKAGLPPRTWTEPEARVELFTAEEFGPPEGDPPPSA